MNRPRSLATLYTSLLTVLTLFALAPAGATEISSEAPPAPTSKASFRWILPASDGPLWDKIQSAFADELQPDDPQPGVDQLDVFRYKYLHKVAILDRTALVIVGHRPAKEISRNNSWDEYFSAFNFDLLTGRKSKIDHADWMWQWRFLKLANFGPSSAPDVAFTYLSCTECEPEKLFASLYFNAGKSVWQVRSWGDGKDLWWTGKDGLVVDKDVNDGGEILSFDCIYGIVDAKKPGFQEFISRCKQVTDTEQGRAKVEDATMLYTLAQGEFKPRRIVNESEAAALTAKLCKGNSSSWFCKLPAYMAGTSGQNNVLDEMFPHPPRSTRELTCFRDLRRTMPMVEVVRHCGEPDELGGSGILIFTYHLLDGSLIAIGAADIHEPLRYANHIESTGIISELF